MTQQPIPTWSTNWMSGILKGTKISEISIPGTHESCARFGGRSQCQWFSITQQLNRGIRFLDIRCKYQAEDEGGRTQKLYFPIHHSSSHQNIFFEEVQAQCIAFLTENPTEFILMNVQIEHDPHVNDPNFSLKFLNLIFPYEKKFWHLKNSVPTIDDCRGKIVLIRAYDDAEKKGWASGGGLVWNGFDHDGNSSNANFETQNAWTTLSGTEKGDEVEKYIRAAPSNAANGRITLNFASFASDTGPGNNAQGMNVRLQKFLKNYKSNGQWGTILGVIPIDFIGNTGDGDCLENLVIEHQLHQEPSRNAVRELV